MLIRCERCSTVYELDETMLAPEGAPVQCTRCENVFVAYPPRAAGRTLVGVPAAPAAPSPSARAGATSRPTPGPRAPAGDRAQGSSPQVYRPTTSPSPPVRPTPVIRKDQVGAFESRLRWSARWRWLAPLLVGAGAIAALSAWLLLSDRADPAAARARAEGLALLSLDDGESLDRAVARIGEAVRLEPRRVEARADAALARIMRAQGLREEWDEAAPEGREPDASDPRTARARALVDAARAELDALDPSSAGLPAVVRARAALLAHDRERQKVLELAGAARARGEADPWLDLAEATVDLHGPAEARDRAVVRLVAITAAHPEILRARFLLARGQASLGRTAEAMAAIEAVLAANGRHEAARRLRERLTAPPPAPAVAPPSPAPEPPRRRPRAEAIVPATPEVTTSPAGDIRPLGEDSDPGREATRSRPLEPRPPEPLPREPEEEPAPRPLN